MVDVEKIRVLLENYFEIDGTYSVDPHSGVVDVTGSVTMRMWAGKKEPQMPVQFGHVTDFFMCSENGLHTLHGAPYHVGGYFDCGANYLKDLQGSPRRVDGYFVCSDNWQLESLMGAPAHVGRNFYCSRCPNLKKLEGSPEYVGNRFCLTWYSHLPLLRLLRYPAINLSNAPAAVTDIMQDYQGQGRNGSLACGAELAKAGFKENARW